MADPPVRAVEVLAALSLTTDLASGLPFEKGLRTCLVATAFADVLALRPDDRAAVFHAARLRAVGCTAVAPENAALFVDDTAFQAALKRLDPGDPAVFGGQLATFGDWAGPRQAALARRFVEVAATEGPRAARAGCEVSRASGPRLGLPAAAVAALDDVYERWDGLGIPAGRRGEQVSAVARVVHVAEQAVLAHAAGGRAAAVAEVSRRAGGHLDPDLAGRFAADSDAVLAPLAAPDLLAEVADAAPDPGAPADLDALARSVAIVADLKGRYLVGHSAHVAALADAAATGLPDEQRSTLRIAAHLHDLGRVAVSSAVWDLPGPLGVADRELVRLHTYWTDRILRRCAGLVRFADVASAHHERCDGSGYHRGTRARRTHSPADDREEVTMTRTCSTADTVAEIYQAFGRGDIPAILARLADDVAWDVWPDNSAQRAGVAHLQARQGPQEVSGFFAGVADWSVNDFRVLDVVGAGRQVVAQISVDFTLPGGRRLADEELHLWTFDDAGRVVAFRHYCDTAKHIAVTRT